MATHAPFHATVFDLKLPDKPGQVFHRELREYEVDAPAIALSGYGAVPGGETDVAAVIRKPFDPNDLIEALQTVTEEVAVVRQ